MAAEVETQRPSARMMLHTGMSESTTQGLTASPSAEAAPRIEEEERFESDSDSDYSDDFKSPSNSRPASLEVGDSGGGVEQSPEVQSKTVYEDEDPGSDLEARPSSLAMEDIPDERDSESHGNTSPAVASEPTPMDDVRSARPVSTSTAATSGGFEDVQLNAEEEPAVAPTYPVGPTLDAQELSELNMETSPLTRDAISAAEELEIDRQTPTIHISIGADSPDGSNYSGSAPQSPTSPSTSSVSISPMTPQEAHMSLDSVHSVALSQSSLDYDHLSSDQVEDVLATPRVSSIRHLRKPSSLEILGNTWGPPARQETLFDLSKDEPLDTPIVGPEHDDENASMNTTSIWQSESTGSIPLLQRDSGSADSDIEQFDWQALDKTEEQEKVDRDLPEGTEDETTAFLLARLEQENAKFTADPKSTVGAAVSKHIARVRSQSRPPSMAHLKKLVSRQDGASMRYSIAPDVEQQLPLDDPPPMTELEFWAALVQDYPSTASRLPTLTTTKIRAGIPPPLRGVVWASMSGARDRALEESFEKLQNEKSSYEGIINKDVGRSFPGVELFRDAEGEGQKMLGRVLKCFSLHDKDIGYCQGLGFLVGPLLMNMGEREAFCVLVRLMDHYALRPSFLPSLSGLHMRIFQFSTLLKQHHPELSHHLSELGVEPAYLSQWFLSCFAVTCPLPMLFRIYDVIFAEGANETVMRVALALFRRNEEKMMASTEFEEVMQLLLGRSLWDVYAMNADDLIDDFTSLGNIITFQRLAELEREYESKDREAVGHSAGFLPDVQAAASRFLGRLWTPTHASTPSKSAASSLSPQSAEKDPQTPMSSILSRPGSFLRRSPSKTSIGTINESSGSEGSGANSIASTAPTDPEIHDMDARYSQADSASMRSKAESLRTVSMSTGQAHMPSAPSIREQQELHTQIEDLLVALSEMQREHAQMAAMLQKEREERNDDHRVVRRLVAKLGPRQQTRDGKEARKSMPPMSKSATEQLQTDIADKRRTLPAQPRSSARDTSTTSTADHTEDDTSKTDDALSKLVCEVQDRLNSNARFSISFETKAQLRTNLVRTREQLATAESNIKSLSERAEFAETSLMTFQGESESLRAEVEELRTRVNDDFKEKQKLELTIQNMEIQMRLEAKALEKKQRADRMARAESTSDVPTIAKVTPERSRTGSISSQAGSVGGLRELKLGRRDSVGSIHSRGSIKLQRRQTGEWSQAPPLVNVAADAVTDAVTSQPAPQPIPVAPTLASAPQSPVHAPVQLATPSHKPSASLSVPSPSGFGARTSSLATKAVLATPAHEPVPDEALLLELVNAKTSEAQARQEVDELKRSLQIQRRRADDAMLQIQAEVATAKLEAEAARAEAARAKEEAKAARDEVFDASPLATPLSFPVTPAAIEEEPKELDTPARKPEPKKADTAPATAGAGWFWSRRTASTTKASIDPPTQ